jgi:hypothetical protein
MDLIGIGSLLPELFNLLLPRALFGSLLTWITIIFTSLPGLQAMTLNEDVLHPYTLQMLFHRQLQVNPYTIIVAAPALVLAFIFVTREVNRFVRRWQGLWLRTMTAITGLYFGSLFWGIIFAMPIKLVMEKQADWNCSCLYRIALIGASLAALFGILVELLWDDKSITEPLEEPL